MTLITAILSLASALIGIFRQRQMLDAGEAIAAERGLRHALDAIERARKIKAGVAVMPRADVDDLLRRPKDRG